MIKRIITALILLPLVMSILFFMPQFPYLEGFVALLVGVSAWEWSGFCYNISAWRLCYCFIAVMVYFLLMGAGPLASLMLMAVVTVWWLFALFRVLNHNQNPQPPLRVLFAGQVLICAAAVSIFALKTVSDWALLLVLVWVFSADTLGLFVGQWVGKNKLIPQVSPGKTWEGLYGALLGSVFISVGFAYFLEFPVVKVVSIGLIVTLISVLGDLLVSCYKRQAGLKDTGSILPGHGGLLDRVDGLLAALPVGWLLINWFTY